MITDNAPKRALIVIDMQNEYFTGDLPIKYPDPQQTVANIDAVMDAAHEAGIPVIIMQQTLSASLPLFAINTDDQQLHPVVASHPHDHYLRKLLPSACPETDLARWLTARDTDTLTVIGHMMHSCNASTINHTLHDGTVVELPHDASGAVSYQNQAGSADTEKIHRVFNAALRSCFAAVMLTQGWVHSMGTGAVPVRDDIYKSNRWARGLLQDEMTQQAT